MKDKPFKIRRTWIRNPAEQVVPNRKKKAQENFRDEVAEGLYEYKNPNSLITCLTCAWVGLEEERIEVESRLSCPVCLGENFRRTHE